MAIYHFRHSKNNRSSGANVINKVAYRLRTKAQFMDFETGELKTRYHPPKGGESIIDLGVHGAPDSLKDPFAWSQAIERAEKRKKAVVCREFEVALPRELSKQEMAEAIKDFIKESITKYGMSAHAVIHHSDNNPHAHILFTERTYDVKNDCLGNKARHYTALGDKALKQARECWSETANRYLEPYNQSITHKSYKDLGITEVEPTKHVGRKNHSIFDKRKIDNNIKSDIRKKLMEKSPYFRRKYANQTTEVDENVEKLLKGINKYKNKSKKRPKTGRGRKI